MTKRNLILLINILLVPITVFWGYFYLEDKKYYFISFLLIIETLFSLMLLFENKNSKLSEIITISVMAALSAISRVAFYAVPEIKPMISLIIIAGLVFGKESAMMVGMLGSFASNIYFGQGPWTPWQMLATSAIGFISGALFEKSKWKENKWVIASFGFFMTFIIYGGIMNFYATLSYTDKLTKEMLFATYAQGIPLDFIHAVSTFVFLILIAKPMIKRLERVKIKYGMM